MTTLAETDGISGVEDAVATTARRQIHASLYKKWTDAGNPGVDFSSYWARISAQVTSLITDVRAVTEDIPIDIPIPERVKMIEHRLVERWREVPPDLGSAETFWGTAKDSAKALLEHAAAQMRENPEWAQPNLGEMTPEQWQAYKKAHGLSNLSGE